MNSYYFRNFDPNDQSQPIKQGVKALLEICGAPFADDMAQQAEACVRHTCNIILSLNDHTLETEWIPAAKRHKDNVARICTRIFQSSKLSRCSNPVTRVTPSVIEFSDGFNIMEEEIRPRSFWKCYRMFRYLQETESAEQMEVVLQIITCIFTIYKQLAVQGPKQDQRAKVHIEEQLSTSIKDNADTNHLQHVHNFLDHIDQCVNGQAEPRSEAAKRYLAAVKMAIKKFQRPKLSRDELPLNTHSSGMSIKNHGTMPSILASAFEGTLDDRDNTKFDELTGYTQSEKLCDLSDVKVRLQRSVFIPHRSKDDMREVHTASSYIQDRMHYHALIQEHFLRQRKTICIWDQMEGVRRTVRGFVLDKLHAIYSLDLHAATDTLDRTEQCLVYIHLLRWMGYSEDEIETLSSHWMDYSSMKLTAMMPYSKEIIEYSMATGQPMGFESSVFSLNLSHDLWVTALEDKLEVDYNIKSKYHCILGDDFIIGFKEDRDMVFPKLYQELMAELNTECNLSKGYIYNDHYPEYQMPIAEFAKNLICDGVNITPLPLGSLAQCNTPQGIISFLTWYKERMNIESIDINNIISLAPGNEDILTLLCCLPVMNQFRALAWGTRKIPTFRICDYRVLLCVAIPYIQDFLMLDVRNELNSDPGYFPKITDDRSFNKEWRKYAKMIIKHKDVLANNKFVGLLDRLETIAIAQSVSIDDICQCILPYKAPDDEILELIPSLKNLTDDNLNILLELFDIIDTLQKSMVDETEKIDVSDELVMSLTYSLEQFKLADFNPTAQRYNTRKEKITAGFDFDELKKQVQQMMVLFNVTTEDIDSTLTYLHDLSITRIYYTWETTKIEVSEPEFTLEFSDIADSLGIDLSFLDE